MKRDIQALATKYIDEVIKDQQELGYTDAEQARREFDQVAAKALQHRRIGVRPPLAGVLWVQVQGILELARGLEGFEYAVELVHGPGLV